MLRKFILCSIVFLISYCGYAQKKLDEIASFYGLKFGAHPTDTDGNLQLDLTISYGMKYYKYRNKRLKEVYGQKIDEINLGFRDDKLEYIDIYLSKPGAADFQAIIDSLEYDFGPSVNFEAVEKGVIEAVRWQDEGTVLDFYRYGSETVDIDDKNKSVIAISRPVN